jgi:hypothetical protein
MIIIQYFGILPGEYFGILPGQLDTQYINDINVVLSR